MEIQGYMLANIEKIKRVRALYKGKELNDETLLMEYDKLGGRITKDGVKIIRGTFWKLPKIEKAETSIETPVEVPKKRGRKPKA